MALTYSIDAIPERTLLGERSVVMLRCTADTDSPSASTFEHRSLVIELDHARLAEPFMVFPNRHAFEDDKGRLIRLASAGGVEDLRAGEERTRAFDLLALFPRALLDLGRFTLTYTVGEAGTEWRSRPAFFEVTSGPETVPLLVGLLSDEAPDLRIRAAELLSLIADKDFGNLGEPNAGNRAAAIRRWQIWWEHEGSQLPWNYESDGATFGKTPEAAPLDRRGERLGGVAYPSLS